MADKEELGIGVSVTFEIAEQSIPLQSGLIEPEDGKALKDAIKEALEKGLEFNLPPGQSIEVPLTEFLSWLEDKFSLPEDVSQLTDSTTVTITALSASTSGRFNIALHFLFKGGIIPDKLGWGNLVDVTEMGLRLVYEPPSQ